VKTYSLATALLAFLAGCFLIAEADAAKPKGPKKLGPLIEWYAGNGYESGQLKVYAADLDGDGIHEVIAAGLIRESKKARIAVVDTTGKDVTKKFFADRRISTEAPQITDLNNDGKDDVIFWGGTDSDFLVQSYVYLSNKKGKHSKIQVTPTIWHHGSGRGDLDGDGSEDFIGTGYKGKGKYVVSYTGGKVVSRPLKYSGNKACFDGYSQYECPRGSDIVIGNFDADPNIEIIISDYLQDEDWMAVEVYDTDSQFIYVRDDTGISMPTEYWETPAGKRQIKGFYKNVNNVTGGDLSHDVRLVKFDINDDGYLDLIRVSRPWQSDKKKGRCESGIWPHYGDLQMLINDGAGVFSDRTKKYLKGWRRNYNAPYNFQFVDVNNDGLTDIFYSEMDIWAKADCSAGATAANGFLVNTGKGFKNFGTRWFKKETKKAIVASKKSGRKSGRFHDGLIVSFAVGNFDGDNKLETASCVRTRDKNSYKSHCQFWFSDIKFRIPKYKKRKASDSVE